ncbi:Gliding motility lipoprotein precursor GldH [Tenacibaculum sp. 190524A02b]|uniref:gliding motility lipoprotein GldH n=1 Tax=Tenacibaculum vairaonense TaxID=3137860 RepID=UPI0032B2579B
MLKTKSKSNIFLLAIIATFFIASCDKNRVFDEYIPIPQQTWNKRNTIQFAFSINDTLKKHNLFLNIRNNKDYAYSNLFVITEMNFPDGNNVIDTLEYDMADAKGKFLGSGVFDVKENKLFYKENITFPNKGNYTLKVRQSMRKNGEIKGIEELEGLTHVGFRIEKTE